MSHKAGCGWLWALLVAGCAAGASAQSNRLPSRVVRKIGRDVEAALHRFGAPGAAVMVIEGDHVALVQGYGFQDADHRLPVAPDSFFEIGSITKQFTAACILQLQEAGKLQVDRPLFDYLPDAPHAREVTLRQLLAHASGLPDYIAGPNGDTDPLVSRPATYRDLIARVASRPLDFPPGSRWSYSNTGYLLLGRVIEAVSGQSYRSYLRQHVLDPLRMTHTYTMAEEQRLPGMAIGYRHLGGRLAPAASFDASWAGAAGFLVAQPADLARWDAALRDGKVVSPDSYRQMTTPFTTTAGEDTGYGFGLFLDQVYAQPRIGHTGGSNGFTTADEYFPRQDVRLIVFTNLGDSTPEAGETLTNIIFADLFPAIAAKALKPAAGEDAAITRTVRGASRELQTGADFARFNARLRGKLAAGAGAKFVASLGPYGPPSAATFKDVRRDPEGDWYDYAIQFGLGVTIPFSAKIGPAGSVISFSVG